MNIIKAETLRNIPDWENLEWTGERTAACASDEPVRVGDKITDRDSFLSALLKIVDDTDLLIEYFNGAVEQREGDSELVDIKYLEEFFLKHNLIDHFYSLEQDAEKKGETITWDWYDWIPMGARLVPMSFYYESICTFVTSLPALQEYWNHLVDAHNFFASSEAPTASKDVFNIFVQGNLKRSGHLKEAGVIAPRCLDLKTGKIYETV